MVVRIIVWSKLLLLLLFRMMSWLKLAEQRIWILFSYVITGKRSSRTAQEVSLFCTRM